LTDAILAPVKVGSIVNEPTNGVVELQRTCFQISLTHVHVEPHGS